MTAVPALAARDWRDYAACRDVHPDLFFPVGDLSVPANAAQAAEAKRVCSRCTVRRPCLDFALVHADGAGIWGGTDEDERRAVRPSLTRGTA